jgi:hypothetical protein
MIVATEFLLYSPVALDEMGFITQGCLLAIESHLPCKAFISNLIQQQTGVYLFGFRNFSISQPVFLCHTLAFPKYMH